MMNDLLSKIFRSLGHKLRWRVLWLAHPKFLLGVAGVVLDRRGRLLLLRNRYWAEGTWGLPAGYVRRSETLEQALVREIREETGLGVRISRLIRFVSGYQLRFEAFFLAELSEGEISIASGEILEARLFPIDELPDGLLETHRGVVREALDLCPLQPGRVETPAAIDDSAQNFKTPLS